MVEIPSLGQEFVKHLVEVAVLEVEFLAEVEVKVLDLQIPLVT